MKLLKKVKAIYSPKQKLFDLILLFFFSIISILIRGYEYGVGDQIHFLTYLNYKLNPTLYPVDYLLKTHTIPYTWYIDFLKLIPFISQQPQLIIFCLYVLGIYLFYVAIFYITRALFKNTVTAWLSLLLFIFPIFIGGSTILTVEDYFIPRMVAEVFLLLCVYMLFTKRFITSAVLAAIGFLFHPLTLLPYPIILVTLSLYRYISIKKIVATCIVFVLIVSPFLNNFLIQQTHSAFFIDAIWRKNLYERMPYIFVSTWKVYNFIFLVLIPIFFYAYQKLTKNKYHIHPIVIGTLFAGYGLFLFSFVSDVFSIRLGLQLQLSRNLYLTIIFCLLYATSLLVIKFRKFAVYIIVILLFFMFIISLQTRVTRGIFFYRPMTSYEIAAIWARYHTKQSSLFLVEPSSTGFRFWSMRSVFTESKEGGDSLYDRPFGIVFDKRQDFFEKTSYAQATVPQIETLIKKFHITNMVTTEILPFSIIFQSGQTKIYQLPKS